MPHQHPVALRVQEVALEEGRDLEVLRLRKRREAAERGGQRLNEPLRGIRARGAGDEIGAEEAQAARGVREADPVAVEGVVGRKEVAPVELAEKRARARGIGRQPAVQPPEEQRPQARLGSRAQKRRTLSSRKMS